MQPILAIGGIEVAQLRNRPGKTENSYAMFVRLLPQEINDGVVSHIHELLLVIVGQNPRGHRSPKVGHQKHTEQNPPPSGALAGETSAQSETEQSNASGQE